MDDVTWNSHSMTAGRRRVTIIEHAPPKSIQSLIHLKSSHCHHHRHLVITCKKKKKKTHADARSENTPSIIHHHSTKTLEQQRDKIIGSSSSHSLRRTRIYSRLAHYLV